MGRGQDLLDAAREGQKHTVEKILAQISKRSGPFTSLRRVPDVNVQDDSGYTSLHHACLHGHKDIVRALLSADASPCIADKQGATPLHLAAFKGDSDIVAMLLIHDNPPVNIDHRTAKHETPLLIAAQFGFTDIVAKLMEKGADVTIRNISNESALDLAAQYGKLKTVQHLLYVHPHIVDQYKPPASRNKVFPLTPLNLASKNGHKDVVLTLLEEGVDPNIRTYDGTPLHEAARFDRASVVRILLEFGADLRIKDRRGNNVHDLLAESSEKATRRVRKVIREYENKIATTYDSDEDLPPFPVHDCSPTPFHKLRTEAAPPLCTNKNASDIIYCKTNSLHGSDDNIYINLYNSFNSMSPTKANTVNINHESDSDSIASSGSFLVSNKRLKIIADTAGLDSTPLLVNHSNVILEIKSRSKNNVSDVATVQPVTKGGNKSEKLQNSDLIKPDSIVSQLNKPAIESKLKPLLSPKPKVLKLHSDSIDKKSSNYDSNLVAPSNINNMYDDDIYQNCGDFSEEYQNLPINNKNVYSFNDDEEHTEVEPPLCSSPTYLVMDPVGKSEEILQSESYIYCSPDPKNPSLSCNAHKEVYKKINKSISVCSLSELTTYKHKLSIPNFFTFGTKRLSVHLKGDAGCIFDSSDYQYIYELNPDTMGGRSKPFLKKRQRAEPMPCFCHEDPNRYMRIIDMINRKRGGMSIEDMYVDMTGVVYSVPKNDGTASNMNESNQSKENDAEKTNNINDFIFKPFNDNDNVNSDVTDPVEKRTVGSIVMKKILQIKSLVTDWKAPETQKNTNNSDSLFSPSPSSLTKNHSQSFVKKLASKCLGLKAKFNSAPNISNNGGLEKEVDVKLKRSDNKSSTNTLLIGNSKFFKRLSKKEESGEIVCNDEFDTISLDRLGSLNRDSVVNRSNRSCPGFKTSLPNISENNELSDSNESVVITELDCDNSNEVKNDTIEAINYNANINIFEPRDRVSVISGESANLVNECYESFYFTKFDNDKSDKDNSFPRPAPRPNVSLSRLNSESTIYENVVIENKTIPTPIARTNMPQKLPLHVIESNVLYENVSLLQEKKPEPPKRNVPPLQVYNSSNKDNNNSSNVSLSSTLSSDSMVDESNLEDIFLSQKSKSFRHGKVSSFCSTSSKSDIYRTPSNSSDDSDITEASAIENVDCSDDTDRNSIYLSNVGTLPNKKTDNSLKKKVLFRHKTFTNIEVDRNSVKVKDLPQWNAEFLKETLANYHIRGTGHCVHNGPTIQEFISIFNRDTLNVGTISSNKNSKRDSFYETAICFCKPRPLKNYKSAENLVDISHQNIDSEVIIDINALKHQQELVLTSFRCFCDTELCNLHSKRRESPTDFIVKFSAIKKSISTPDITLENPPYSIVQKGNLPKNKSVPRNLQEPYADTDVIDIVARDKLKECAKASSSNTLSQPSTLSSSSAGLYSIKDIAEVISLNSASTTNNSLSCASDILHLPLRKSSSSEHSGHWSLQSCNSNVTIKSDMSFKSCIEESSDEDLDETLHSDVDSSDADTIKSDVSTSKRPWVHSDSFRFGSNTKPETIHVIREDSSFDDSKVDSIVESGISLGGSESSSSECEEDSGVPMVDANVSLGTASLERVSVVGGDCSGSGRRRWDETEGTSEGDALSVSSAASSCAPLHLAYHNDYNKVSSAKQYLKLGRSVDHYVDGKLSYTEYEESHNNSPRIAPVPHPRPSLKQRSQPVAITAMYENVVIKEQNPRRKLRRNSFAPANDNIEIRMNDNRTRKYSNQERSSMESLLDNQSMNSPSNMEGYCEGPKTVVPLSPTHYDQPPTPDHPPPSARQAERSIHEKIRPLSQLIMEVVEEIRIRKKSQGDLMNS